MIYSTQLSLLASRSRIEATQNSERNSTVKNAKMTNSTQATQLNATSSNPPTSPLQRSDVEVYAQVILLVIICIGSVFGNAFVVGIVVFNNKLHKPTYYFIGSLASADFLVGAIYIPFYIVSSLAQKWYLSLAWCEWHAFFISLSLNASLMTLCLVSVDRFLAITDPLR